MGPTLGFDTEQRNSFLNQIWCFLQLKQDSDNTIHSLLCENHTLMMSFSVVGAHNRQAFYMFK